MTMFAHARATCLLAVFAAALQQCGAFGAWHSPADNHVYSMIELVAEAGYDLEEHFVTTKDGYVLHLFRLPRAKNESAQPDMHKPPVFLQHALLDSSCSWVNNKNNQSLGFILADLGYDVWMGNSRGNTFSKNHTSLSTSDARFWQFSFDEMAQYDVPASVEYVLKTNSASKLVYIGHSQGTTIGIAGMAYSQKLQQKISLAVMMAPAVYLQHVTSTSARTLATFEADQLVMLTGAKEFLPSSFVLQLLFGSVCTLHPEQCANIVSLLCGYNPDNINATRLGVYLSYTPAGTSVQNIAHWAQAMRLKKPTFPRYDYGTSCRTWTFRERRCNQNMYGQRAPPEYDLDSIQVPIIFASGANDQLADPTDVSILLKQLGKNIIFHQEEPSFEHLDFTWSYKAKELVYDKFLPYVADASRDSDAFVSMVWAAAA